MSTWSTGEYDKSEGTGWFGSEEGGFWDDIGDFFLGEDDNPDTVEELLESEGGLSEALGGIIEDVEEMALEMASSPGQEAILEAVSWGDVAESVLDGGDYFSEVEEMVGEGYEAVSDIMVEAYSMIEEAKEAAVSNDLLMAGASIWIQESDRAPN